LIDLIERAKELIILQGLLKRHPVVGIIGARQVGKTTLARTLVSKCRKSVTYFDLDDPKDMARLPDPMLALMDHKGLVFIDEVEHQPGILQILRVLTDPPQLPARFLIPGSASPLLPRQSLETLAGRIICHRLNGFSMDEIGPEKH